MSSEASTHLLVIGTINVDRVWQVPLLPRAGRTILATAVRREFGGKGANQAVAAARQGARVRLLGAVGGDEEGRLYREHLLREHVDITNVAIHPERGTGTAHVYVEARGENLIVVDRGANASLDAQFVQRAFGQGPPPDVVLLQLECPLAGAVEALRIAQQRSVRSILNASPAVPEFPWGDVAIDTVVVNEHECVEVFGCGPDELRAASAAARRDLLSRRTMANLIVTRGAQPTLHLSAAELQSVPTWPVEPVDTVGAGDTFTGVLATRLAEGLRWYDAIREANAAAALATLALGAQTGMPMRTAIAALARPAKSSVAPSNPISKHSP